MTKEELKNEISKLTKEDVFGLTFTKKNGEERVYDNCRVGVYIANENATRKGITAQEQRERGNLQFYCDDLNGYRIAKFDAIKEFRHNDEVHKIVG